MPQLLLLQKTLISVEGLGRYLCPDLNLWDTARPLMEEWMRERRSVRRLLTGLKHDAPIWLERLPTLPDRLLRIVERLEERPPPPPSPAWTQGPAAGLLGGTVAALAILYLPPLHALITLLLLTGLALYSHR